jgi:hypothetical protein
MKAVDFGDISPFLDVDFSSGTLMWMERDQSHFTSFKAFCTWNRRYAGRPALDYLDPHGYRCGRLFDRPIKAHRAIWAIATGQWPDAIDHINGVRSDNRLCNLRSADAATNSRNAGRRIDNKSGHVGVCWDARRAKWLATIAGRQIGRFSSKDEAVAARVAASLANNFHPNHGDIR